MHLWWCGGARGHADPDDAGQGDGHRGDGRERGAGVWWWGSSGEHGNTHGDRPGAGGVRVAPGRRTALSSVQAGAHPDLTTIGAFDTENSDGATVGNVKNIVHDLPAGFAGDLVDTPTCEAALFLQATVRSLHRSVSRRRSRSHRRGCQHLSRAGIQPRAGTWPGREDRLQHRRRIPLRGGYRRQCTRRRRYASWGRTHGVRSVWVEGDVL